MKFKSDIEIQAGVEAGGSTGSNGQVLSSTGSGVAWIDQSAVSADSAESVHISVKNTSGAQILKGTPIYVTGETGNSGKIEIAPADASDSAKMPALGLLESTLANNGEGFCVQGGLLEGLATATIDGASTTANDTVYVKPGGGLTMTKPTGTGLIQNIAKVARVHASNGSLVVSSILRTNDVPNLPTGRIWVGDGNTIVSDTVYIDEPNNRVGIGTPTPSTPLHIRADVPSIRLQDITSTDNHYLTGNNGELRVQSSGYITMRPGAAVSTTFLANGNVGIGTTSPGAKLHIGGLAANSSGLLLESPTSEVNVNFNFIIGDTSLGLHSKNLVIKGSSGSSDIAFSPSSTYPGLMVLDGSAGNVGIGITAPSTKLDVAGNANISDTLAIGSLSTVPTASLGRALNIQVLANSSGTTVAQWLDIDRTITTDSTNASTWGMVLRNASTTTSTANDGKIYGAQIIGRHQGTGGIESAMGVRSTADINTTGTITTTGTLWGSYNEAQVTNGSVTFANSGIFGSASRGQVLGSGTVNITSQGVVGGALIGVLNNVNAAVNRVVGGEFELDLQNGTTDKAHVVSLNTFNIVSPTNLSIDEFAYIYLGEDVAIPTTITDNAYFIKSLTSLPSELAGSIEATSFIKTGGTSSQFLKADGSIDSTSYAPATGGSYLPLAGGTMTGQITATPGIEMGAGNINFADSGKVRLGNSSDLQIYHDGSNSYISDTGTGDLIITADNDLTFKDGSGNIMANMNASNSVELMFGNSKKFETTTFGSKVTGYIQVTSGVDVTGGNIDLLDNSKIRLGTSQDLQIYHDGSDSYINDTGTGHLVLNTNGASMKFLFGSEFMAQFEANGSVDLYHNNVKKFETTSAGVTVTGEGYSTGGWGVGTGETPVGRIFNNSGVFAIRAETGRQISFGNVTNGEFMRIDSYGKVGIGTTDPGAKLHILSPETSSFDQVIKLSGQVGVGGGPAVFFKTSGADSDNRYGVKLGAVRSDSNNGSSVFKIQQELDNGSGTLIGLTDTFTINQYGNVGIGTDSPNEKLVVATGASGWGVFHGASGWNGLALMGNSAGSGSALIFGNDYAATPTEEYRIWLDGATDKLIFTPGATYKGDPSAITPTMVMDSGGNVGIGTTSPGVNFQVGDGTTDTSSKFYHNDNTYTQISGYGLYFSRLASYIRPVFDGTQDLYFGNINRTWKSIQFDATTITFDNNSSEAMRITSTGNVGIGTTSPIYKLAVSGGIEAGGKVTYSKSAGSLDTTGYAVAGLLASYNGQSACFTFTAIGNAGHYQKVVYSCWNTSGTWNTSKVIDEGTNGLDIEASVNASTITFTFKSRSGSLNYTPRVTVEASGSAINSTYA